MASSTLFHVLLPFRNRRNPRGRGGGRGKGQWTSIVALSRDNIVVCVIYFFPFLHPSECCSNPKICYVDVRFDCCNLVNLAAFHTFKSASVPLIPWPIYTCVFFPPNFVLNPLQPRYFYLPHSHNRLPCRNLASTDAKLFFSPSFQPSPPFPASAVMPPPFLPPVSSRVYSPLWSRRGRLALGGGRNRFHGLRGLHSIFRWYARWKRWGCARKGRWKGCVGKVRRTYAGQ